MDFVVETKERRGTPNPQRSKTLAERTVKDIRLATRRHFSAEDKIRIGAGRSARRIQHCRVLPQGRHRPESVLHLVEGVMEADKRRLAGDTARAPTAATEGRIRLIYTASCAECFDDGQAHF